VSVLLEVDEAVTVVGCDCGGVIVFSHAVMVVSGIAAASSKK
jgi:hypothetical protein